MTFKETFELRTCPRWPPISRTQPQSDRDRITQLEARVAALEQQLDQSEMDREFTEAQRNAAEVHAVFAIQECALLRHQANRHAEKKDGHGRRVHVTARVMTSEEGLRLCEEDRAAREAKEREKAEKKSKKDVVDKENMIRRATQVAIMVFTGSLASKKKVELGDLTSALGFDVNPKQTKVDLLDLINKKFDAEQGLKNDECFVGIFKRGHKRSAPLDDTPAGIEPQAPPPLQRRRLNTEHHPPIASPSRLPVPEHCQHLFRAYPPPHPSYYAYPPQWHSASFDHSHLPQ